MEGDDGDESAARQHRTNADFIELDPDDKQLFIKTIAPDVSRIELEEVSITVCLYDLHADS